MHEKRKKIWIHRFQTLLLWRIVFYFLVYQVAVWYIVNVEANARTLVVDLFGTDLANRVMLLTYGIVLLLGLLFISDAIRFAHRIVGPLVRFSQICRAIRDGESVLLVKLRKHDLLDEFRDEFNDMLKALQERGALTLQEAEDKRAEAQPVETAGIR